MKILLDENLPSAMCRHLQRMFQKHKFMSSGVEIGRGIADVELFKRARELGIDIFMTSDIKQLDRLEERAACRAAGMHWVGIPKTRKTKYAKGRAAKRAEIGMMLANFTYVEQRIKESKKPQAFLLEYSPDKLCCQKGYPQDI